MGRVSKIAKEHQRAIHKMVNLEYVKLLLLHIGLGLVLYLYEPLAPLFLSVTFFYFLFIIIDRKNKGKEELMAAAYIAGAEVFYRMTGGSVFYETGKYAVILLLLTGMFFKGASAKTTPFWIYLFILVPGILIASQALNYDTVFRKAVAFNLSGPVCLGVSALYCYYKKISRIQFEKVIVMLLLPLISTMAYIYFYTPTLRESIVNMSGNYAATAGYGPNQISTIMGLGAFLLVTRLFVIKSKVINIIDLVLLGMMSYRAMVTFSRGGVLTGIVCALAFIGVLYYKREYRERARLRFKMLVLAGALFCSWAYTSMRTGGLILNRYTGRDAGGELKEDITTGRIELIETELEGFYHNPVLGLGVGKGYDFRQEQMGIEIATHSEVSRLLSEHGMLGVIAVLILIFVPIIFWTKFKNNYYFLAFLAFWFLTINHSAMRIALPAFVYGLALLYIVDEKKNSLYR